MTTKSAGSTPPIPGTNGVAEAQYLRLGGVDQWVLVRGADAASNPVLVLLHGGPGISETAYWRYCNSTALEGSYTVVYWDQRGAGKSYDPANIPKETMTVERLLSDLDELVDFLCERFGKKSVTLFGHSWGSVLGPLYASRFPNKVQAYVGCGQLGDWAKSESATYDYALREAERRGCRRAATRLRQVGPPPHADAKSLLVQRNLLAELDGDVSVRGILKQLRMFHSVPETSVFELFRVYKVVSFSLDAMWSEVTTLNLVESVPRLAMPAFFLLGRQDHCVLPEISAEFADSVESPSKRVVWFEESGHMPFMDEPGKFNEMMVNLVRPTLD